MPGDVTTQTPKYPKVSVSYVNLVLRAFGLDRQHHATLWNDAKLLLHLKCRRSMTMWTRAYFHSTESLVSFAFHTLYNDTLLFNMFLTKSVLLIKINNKNCVPVLTP